MAMPIGGDVKEISTGHGPVRVRDTGTGTPVLLVHSLLLDGGLYDEVVPLLVAAGFRCVVPDLPLGAHLPALNPDADVTPPGLTRLLTEVLDALDLDRVAVVGVDTGGALTQLLMADHRDRVDRIVLTACDAYEDFPPRIGKPLQVMLKSRGGSWLYAHLMRLRACRRLINLRMFTHSHVSDETCRRWTEPLRHPDVRRDLRNAVAEMHPRYTLAAAAANADFPHPVLIAWGDDARFFPRRLGERLAKELPHSEFVTIEDCAAFAALDQPKRLAQLIEAHLTTSRFS